MNSRTTAGYWLGRLGMTVTVLSLIAGCATHAPPKVDEERVKHFSARGYLTENRAGVTKASSSWIAGGGAFEITWTAPVSGNGLPVVIYLPGLGESRSSGESWRTTWAEAGYAVLSIQLLSEDQMIWSSGAARRGDFALVARERYAKEAASARLNALALLVTELQKPHKDDDALLRRLDLSRIALVGFDVGAHTAMLVAGEVPNVSSQPVHLPVPIVAIVALSPFANFSGSALGTRYQSIAGPVLSVSSSDDFDVLGAVTSPSVRKAPFEYMPSRDAYLLWLDTATHDVISGSGLSTGSESAATTSAINSDRQEPQGGSRRGTRRSAPEHSGNSRGSSDAGSFGVGRASRPSPTDQAINISIIQGVTTAFLDVYLKQDTIAKEWLQKDAARWIGERGELKRK